jgi:stress response protein SCP2
VLLYEIPEDFNHVVFDLYWGYPYSGRDYLDASCLVFQNAQFLSLADYRHHSVQGIKHSGDVMNDFNRTGHHTIHVYLKELPSNVTHLFFTLSAWNSPNISKYPNPSLKFYEASNILKDLCKTTFTHANNSQAVVMCSVSRSSHGRWGVYESGKLSAGNASRYGPIKNTIQNLITSGY